MTVTEALLPRQRDVLLDGSVMFTISECNGGVAPPTERCVVRWQHNVHNQ